MTDVTPMTPGEQRRLYIIAKASIMVLRALYPTLGYALDDASADRIRKIIERLHQGHNELVDAIHVRTGK